MSDMGVSNSIATPQAALDAAGGGALKAAFAAIKNSPNALRVAKEFEAAFLGQMLQPMFTGVDAEEPFGGGQAEQTYRPMLINEYANALTKRGGIGIADSVLNEIVKMQMRQGEIAGVNAYGAPLEPAPPAEQRLTDKQGD